MLRNNSNKFLNEESEKELPVMNTRLMQKEGKFEQRRPLIFADPEMPRMYGDIEFCFTETEDQILHMLIHSHNLRSRLEAIYYAVGAGIVFALDEDATIVGEEMGNVAVIDRVNKLISGIICEFEMDDAPWKSSEYGLKHIDLPWNPLVIYAMDKIRKPRELKRSTIKRLFRDGIYSMGGIRGSYEEYDLEFKRKIRYFDWIMEIYAKSHPYTRPDIGPDQP
jgi:hypothetical protein